MNKCASKFVMAIGAIFVVCIMLPVGQAQALLIGPYDGVGNNHDASFFGDNIILLDKDEFNDGTAEGNIADPYLQVVDSDKEPFQEATVSWNLTDLGLEAWYVAVKDGLTPDAVGIKWLWYKVAEDQRIVGGGNVATWANGAGAISNIALYGRSIPDASIMFLLGPALIALGIFKRKSKKS